MFSLHSNDCNTLSIFIKIFSLPRISFSSLPLSYLILSSLSPSLLSSPLLFSSPLLSSLWLYQLDLARKLEKIAAEKGVQIFLASDVVVADKFAADAAVQVSESSCERERECHLMSSCVMSCTTLYCSIPFLSHSITEDNQKKHNPFLLPSFSFPFLTFYSHNFSSHITHLLLFS